MPRDIHPFALWTVRALFVNLMAMGGSRRLGGLGRRAPLYVAMAAVAARAFWLLPEHRPPSVLLFLGLASAATIGHAVPVAQGTVGIWRARKTFPYPVAVCCALLLSWPWAVACWGLAAISSGCYIRQYRTTPGRMATGASMVTLAAAGSWMAGRAVLPSGVGARPEAVSVVIASVATVAAYRFIVSLCWQQAHGGWTNRRWRTAAWDWLVGEGVGIWVGMALGATFGSAAVLLAVDSQFTLALFALPYTSIVAGASYASISERERDRMRTLAALGNELHRSTAEEEVLDHLTEATIEMLACPSVTYRNEPPSGGEAGAELPGGGWIVAAARYGPPGFLGRYTRDERRVLAVVAASAASALETVRIVAHHQAVAAIDSLTGLPNRPAFEDMFAAAAEDARRTDRDVGVLFVDVDRFKLVNDVHGHDAGDAALRAVGRRLRGAARAGEVIARWGGEEFVALIMATGGEPDLAAVGERFRGAVAARPMALDNGTAIALSVSIGGALLQEGELFADAVAAADHAMLAAKRAGRDRVLIAVDTRAATARRS